MDRTSTGGTRATHPFACAIGLLLACSAVGCKSQPVNPFSARDEAAAIELEAESTAPAAAEPHPQSSAFDAALLESDAWAERVPPPFVKRDPAFRRWRHHALDSIIDWPPSSRPDLSTAAMSSNPVVAANVAIILAHWGQGQPTPLLVSAIRATPIRLPLRCAAVEALGISRDAANAAALRQLLEEFAPLTNPGDALPRLPQLPPDLHADMIRALAKHKLPGDEAWFTAALRSPAWNVRYEGVAAWTQVKGELPQLAIDRRMDQDPRVRSQALRMIAAHRETNAVEYLQQGLSDQSIEVHAAAIEALGELGSEQATTLLRKLKEDRSELSRAAAVMALSAAGVRDEVVASARDSSKQVRLAVAQTLTTLVDAGQQAASDAVLTAHTLARDKSVEVQKSAVSAVESWPLEQAGPILLLSIAEGGYTARKAAAEQLARRWPPAADFPIDAMAARREVALGELRRLWMDQFGALDETVGAARLAAQQVVELTNEQIRDVRQCVDTLSRSDSSESARRAAADRLAALGSPLVAELSRELSARGGLPGTVYEDVLPEIQAAFAVLRRFSSPNVLERRAAAVELAAQAVHAPLSPLAVHRLAELIEAEKDPVVWRSALAALAQDTSDDALHVAYMAVGNTSVEVRRKACEYLAEHGAPRHIPVLLPALNDADATVVLAAVRALGAVGHLDDPQPLVRLLATADKQLRLEAAATLARLQFLQGVAGLERLALDTEIEVRIRAAQTMGQIGDRVFIAALMAMLVDKPDVGRNAMASLATLTGVNPAASADGSPVPHDEQVRRWQQWHREQH